MHTEQLIENLRGLRAAQPRALRAGRSQPWLVQTLRDYLVTPRPYWEVEDIEHEILEVWRDVLELGYDVHESDAQAFSEFFTRLGFLHKYKIYGVKIALPFGYSLFDLHDGAGFSFQLHREPKFEGFHILRPKDHSVVYLANTDEWANSGKAWAQDYFAGGEAPDRFPPGALAPQEGDVVDIVDTETVHAVIGCVLEEYASCSVDSVVRLHDQNVRDSPTLPAEHPSVAGLLGVGSGGLPVRHLQRTPTGWVDGLRDGDVQGTVINTPDMTGYRVLLDAGQTLQIAPHDGVTSVIPATGALTATSESTTVELAAGDPLVVCAGAEFTLRATSPASLSVHHVSSEMTRYSWTR